MIMFKLKSDMRLFKRKNQVWYVELKRGIWRSLDTKDKKEAKVRFKDLQREALKGKLISLDKQPSITLDDFLKEYEKWAENNLSYTTYKRIARILPKFMQVVSKNRLLSSVKKKDLSNFIDFCRQRGNKPTTINIELRHTKAAFSKAVEWEYLKTNPFQKYPQVKFYKKDPQFLKIKEIEKVFNVIGDNRKYRLIFAMYVYTGARREEIHRLEWRDIKKEFIYIRKTKNYKPRSIPIAKSLREILAEYPVGVGRLFDVSLDQMGRRIKYYLRKAGCGKLRPHDLRHTFASHLIMAGNDLKTVGELLGHTSYAATQIYTHLLQEHKVKAINKLPY